MKKTAFKMLALLLAMSFPLTGCGRKSSSSGSKVTTVVFGIRQDLTPNSYIDSNGKPTGENVEVMEAVDKLLPQYQFQYDAVDSDSNLVGVESGKYAGSLGNYFKTSEREEKYLFPQANISAGTLGFIVLKKYSGLKSYSDVASKGLTVVPKPASDAVYATILQYNKSNPNNKVKCDTVADKIAVGTACQMVLDGRYDVAVFLKDNYTSVKSTVDPKDQLVFVPFDQIKTWVIFGKNQTELANAYDGAMKKLEANGTLSKISEKYYKENVFSSKAAS